jgi:hypothetical protein
MPKLSSLAPSQPLKVTITKTTDGQSDYVQIMSQDQFSVNIVLIAPAIEVLDTRSKK